MGEPSSRVEAILQNILGADNILVPPGSQVEEILQAIYYNTEYENNPKSRVAEILLAIKNKGVYDGPVLSRVEDILVHKLNNIPYTKHKKEDLSRVEQLLLDWLEQGGGEEIIEYTGTFPMTILANGEPLLDYIISGNTVQNGTPTPDSPVMPQGTGERTGNLFDAATAYGAMYSDGVITGQAANINNIKNKVTADMIGKTYTISITPLRMVSRAFITMSINGTTYWRENELTVNQRSSFQFSPVTENDLWYITYDIGGVCSYKDIMVNEGSTTLPYEPYGYKIPISSAGQTTPIYLGEVETTRKVKMLVLTGGENFYVSNKCFVLWLYDVQYPNSKQELIYCTHYKGRTPTYRDSLANGQCMIAINQNQIAIKDLSYATADDFKSYLAAQYAAGTPVTVWYVLATEETAVVNEPLMRIGDYADTLSMEQAGVDVPTNEKPTETVIDIPTSVKPSEGYIKYTEPTDGPTPKTKVLGTKDHEIYMTSNDEVYVLRR